MLLCSEGFECVQHLGPAEKDANHPKTSEKISQGQNKTDIKLNK